MTRGYQNLAGYGLGMPSFGVDYGISGAAGDDSALRARATENQHADQYPFGADDLIRTVVALSHLNMNNNDDNYPVQWSTAMIGGVGDSCVYLAYTSGAERRQYWHTGPASFTPFLHELNGSPQINNVAVWVVGTFADTLLHRCRREWDAGQEPDVPLSIDSLWMDNDEVAGDNGPVDNPWTLEPDTLYFKEHMLVPDTALAEAQSDSCVLTDEAWDSLRFRYLFSKPCNVRLTIVRDVDLDRVLDALDDTVCVFRSCLQDTTERSHFDEANWGEEWAWIVENFSWIC
jgi:hypothetical protein